LGDLTLPVILLFAALGITAIAATLATWQLLRGPCAATRSVSLDMLLVITLPLIVGVGVVAGRAIYLDVAMMYALLAFLGVISLARYFDRGL